MKKVFAKVYTSERTQVLVKLDDGDKGPEVRYFFVPKDLGVCSVVLTFSDDDIGWDKAEAHFEEVTEDLATAIAFDAMDRIECLATD